MSTKYGNVSTDHILFICSGAFHQCKPSDMLAELQGRLPIRVELKGLTCAQALLATSVADPIPEEQQRGTLRIADVYVPEQPNSPYHSHPSLPGDFFK